MTLHGVRTVAEQEFRLRIRAGRWRWLLGLWFAVVLGFAVLLRLGLAAVSGSEDDQPFGPPLFGGVMLFVLGLGLLVVPALTAQSVNGDRERGTLATLQVTRLTAAEIGVGKLVAAWGTALAFLGLTSPIVLWAIAEGGLTVGKVVVTMLVVALLLGVVCAVAQALSALLARSITSALLSYLTVFALTIGTLIAFGLATALSTEWATVTYQQQPLDPATGEPIPGDPTTETYRTQRARPDRTWPLLSPNPFVILADAAPRLPTRVDPVSGRPLPRPLDPLGELGNAVRDARRPPHESGQPFEGPPRPQPGPVWTYGLAFDVALAAGAVLVTIRRLRTPLRRLPRGVRIA
ncbi:MAG: ABC transporter permease [Actinomycetes bacterium]